MPSCPASASSACLPFCCALSTNSAQSGGLLSTHALTSLGLCVYTFPALALRAGTQCGSTLELWSLLVLRVGVQRLGLRSVSKAATCE